MFQASKQKLAQITSSSIERSNILPRDPFTTPKMTSSQNSSYHFRANVFNKSLKSILSSPSQNMLTRHQREILRVKSFDEKSGCLLAAQFQLIHRHKIKTHLLQLQPSDIQTHNNVNFTTDSQQIIKQPSNLRIKICHIQKSRTEIDSQIDSSYKLKTVSIHHGAKSDNNKFDFLLRQTQNLKKSMMSYQELSIINPQISNPHNLPLLSPKQIKVFTPTKIIHQSQDKLQKILENHNAEKFDHIQLIKSTSQLNHTESYYHNETHKIKVDQFYNDQNKLLQGKVKSWINLEKSKRKNLQVFNGIKNYSHNPTQLNCSPYSKNYII